MKHWTIDDIAWDHFDRSKVDPEILKAVKAAALVEHNGYDYAAYLCSVFADDPDFCQAAKDWAEEEVQHGRALRRWAEYADPTFDFDDAFARFTRDITLPLDAKQSIRGSRSGELVARCIVEVGTSSFYGAMAAATEEPVLKSIAMRIRADELRHYKLFYNHLNRYLEREQLGPTRRLMIALSRIRETEDDELAYAYHCANGLAGPYDRSACIAAYSRRAYGMYKRPHVERAVMMTCKAAGLDPQSRVARLLGDASWWLMRKKVGWLERRAA
ncbi:ferritin-like domain-containing protein [Tistrella mobilis]|jgi:rubrerythrin|uniref:ferritin-like domain-containing protein n=1 Tax=Tistrella mobilis TaxID=171437 RepID=UPI003558157D